MFLLKTSCGLENKHPYFLPILKIICVGFRVILKESIPIAKAVLLFTLQTVFRTCCFLSYVAEKLFFHRTGCHNNFAKGFQERLVLQYEMLVFDSYYAQIYHQARM